MNGVTDGITDGVEWNDLIHSVKAMLTCCKSCPDLYGEMRLSFEYQSLIEN